MQTYATVHAWTMPWTPCKTRLQPAPATDQEARQDVVVVLVLPKPDLDLCVHAVVPEFNTNLDRPRGAEMRSAFHILGPGGITL
jgi:hypothetical protein